MGFAAWLPPRGTTCLLDCLGWTFLGTPPTASQSAHSNSSKWITSSVKTCFTCSLTRDSVPEFSMM